MSACEVLVLSGAGEVSAMLAARVAKAASHAIEKSGKFVIALSGGSLPKSLAGLKAIDGEPLSMVNAWVATTRSFQASLGTSGTSFLPTSVACPSTTPTEPPFAAVGVADLERQIVFRQTTDPSVRAAAGPHSQGNYLACMGSLLNDVPIPAAQAHRPPFRPSRCQAAIQGFGFSRLLLVRLLRRFTL